MIRFESRAGSSVSMLDQDAKNMLQLMGHSGSVPGALDAEQTAAALKQLQDAILAETSQHESGDELIKSNSPVEAAVNAEHQPHEHERPVSMSTRAYPLIQLLEAAQEKQENVMWDHENSVF